MNSLMVFGLEIAVCLSLSLAVSSYLRPVLGEVLEGLCGTPLAARFWMTFTHLMLLLVPLLLVLWLSHTATLSFDLLAELLRNTLLRTLIGLMLGVVTVAANVWLFAVDSHRQKTAARNPSAVADGGC
jgi:hypothetical protein